MFKIKETSIVECICYDEEIKTRQQQGKINHQLGIFCIEEVFSKSPQALRDRV